MNSVKDATALDGLTREVWDLVKNGLDTRLLEVKAEELCDGAGGKNPDTVVDFCKSYARRSGLTDKAFGQFASELFDLFIGESIDKKEGFRDMGKGEVSFMRPCSCKSKKTCACSGSELPGILLRYETAKQLLTRLEEGEAHGSSELAELDETLEDKIGTTRENLKVMAEGMITTLIAAIDSQETRGFVDRAALDKRYKMAFTAIKADPLAYLREIESILGA